MGQQPVYMPPHVIAFNDQLSSDVYPSFEIGDPAASYSESVSELHWPNSWYIDNTNMKQ